MIERWELLQAQPRSDQQDAAQQHQQLTSDFNDITLWLDNMITKLDFLQQSDPAISIEGLEAKAKELKVEFKTKHNRSDVKYSICLFLFICLLLQEMQKVFTRYKSAMLSVNLRAQVAPELQEELAHMNRDWSRACTGLQQWDTSLRKTLMRCKVSVLKDKNPHDVWRLE